MGKYQYEIAPFQLVVILEWIGANNGDYDGFNALTFIRL
jgi:hypothetical protein